MSMVFPIETHLLRSSGTAAAAASSPARNNKKNGSAEADPFLILYAFDRISD